MPTSKKIGNRTGTTKRGAVKRKTAKKAAPLSRNANVKSSSKRIAGTTKRKAAKRRARIVREG
jgi:hypothetical protein